MTVGRPKKYNDPNEALRVAQRNYTANNKETRQYTNDKSAAKRFITKKASADDLIELESLIKERKLDLG